LNIYIAPLRESEALPTQVSATNRQTRYGHCTMTSRSTVVGWVPWKRDKTWGVGLSWTWRHA